MSDTILTPALVYLVMGAALVAYAVTGGADYGGGVWHLLARGPRRGDVRKAVERAIAPIWEANHVWLIFLVVMTFTVFPRAFAVLATALHIPLTVALVGMVLRGSSFVLRAYGMDTPAHNRLWDVAFGVSSLLVPFLLGMSLAAVASGDIRVDMPAAGGSAHVTSGFFAGWLTPFALALGAFAVCLFMLLSAVYLAYDAGLVDEGDVREHFRRRALAMELVGFAASALVLWRARADAPTLYDSLVATPWAAPAQGLVFVLAVAVGVALWVGRFGAARFLAAAQVAVIVVGFGLAMGGHLVMPDVTVHNAGARSEVLGPLLPALLVGGALVVPSLWFLFRLFKTRRATTTR